MMAVAEQQVLDIIFRALRALNEELGNSNQVPVAIDTPLFGGTAALDSLSLVSVIIDVEGGIYTDLNRNISLTDDRAMNEPVSPFTDVRSLLNYTMILLSEAEPA